MTIVLVLVVVYLAYRYFENEEKQIRMLKKKIKIELDRIKREQLYDGCSPEEKEWIAMAEKEIREE